MQKLLEDLTKNPWVQRIGKRAQESQSPLRKMVGTLQTEAKQLLEFDDDGYHAALDVLNKHLQPFPKKSGWWLPPKNYAINMTLLGTINVWDFSALPLFATRNAYRPKGERLPEGVVLDPDWKPVSKNDPLYNETLTATAEVAEKLVKLVKNMDQTIGERVELELGFIETHYKVQIPSGVKSAIIAEMLPIAKRRWGSNRLRRKKVLYPFDGSKKIELGSWD